MNISQQTRDEIVQLYSQHIPVRKIMSRFGVSRSSIYNFLKLDRMHISQITSMEFEIRRPRQENEILKTSGCCLSAPLTEEEEKALREELDRMYPPPQVFDGWRAWYKYSSIEVTAALFFGFSAGINPGELLDFLAGFVCLDIYRDDI